MFFFQGTVETLPLKVWAILEYLIFLGIDSAIAIQVTPLLTGVTLDCFLISLNWSITYNARPFNISSRWGVEIFP